jgi:hypothetical protein
MVTVRPVFIKMQVVEVGAFFCQVQGQVKVRQIRAAQRPILATDPRLTLMRVATAARHESAGQTLVP